MQATPLELPLEKHPGKIPVLVITDHANLQYYQDLKRLPARVHSWNAERVDYNMKFIYKPGTQNHADGLSCHPDHATGQEENFEVQTFPNDMFNQDTPEWQPKINEMNIGWTGVTGEDIL